jgi:trans-aconitate methyltransferase
MSPDSSQDVPSPLEFRDMVDARAWAATAEQRPGRNELGSGPGFLAERLLRRLPDAHYTALDFSPAMHELARGCRSVGPSPFGVQSPEGR